MTHRRGLSFPQILAVIGVLGFIGLVMAPMFHQTYCGCGVPTSLGNLKQIGLSAIMYDNDYDDRLPMLAYRKGGNGCLPASDGAIVFTAYDALYPYVRHADVYTNPLEPKEIKLWDPSDPGSSVFGQFGWRVSTNVWTTGFSPNFRLFEDRAINAPLGNNNPVVDSDDLKHQEAIPTFYTATFVPQDGSNTSQLTSSASSPDLYLGDYQLPRTKLAEFNLPGQLYRSKSLTLCFLDGHAKSVTSSPTGDLAPDWSTGTKQMIPTYHFPYDMTGIPGVVAEQYKAGINPPCR